MAQTISTLGCKKGKGRERQLVDDAAPLPDEGADGAATALPSTHVVAIFLGRPRERVSGGSGFPSALRKEKAGVRKNRGGGGGGVSRPPIALAHLPVRPACWRHRRRLRRAPPCCSFSLYARAASNQRPGARPRRKGRGFASGLRPLRSGKKDTCVAYIDVIEAEACFTDVG